MISSLEQAEEYFSQFIAKASQTTGKDITVDRMWPLLKLVDNPQDKLRVIHIAGTSGKTSTAYFTASLINQAGHTVGLTVSPHVSSLRERIQINGSPVSESEFCRLLNQFVELLGNNPDASYFELIIVFALWAFVENDVEYAVVETGLGGLHDGTNVCRRQDKICIITDIGLDHQHVLGNSVSEIAQQKAGIIHEKNTIFTYEQSSEIMQKIHNRATSKHAEINIVPEPQIATKSQFATFQQRNWFLAKAVYEYVAGRDGLGALSNKQLITSQVQVPGRMQEVLYGDKVFVLDGAHNQQKMTAFVESFVQKYPDIKVPILLGMKEGKEYREVIKVIKPITTSVFCIGFESLQDMPIKSINPEKLVEACIENGINSASVVGSIGEAIEIMKSTDDRVCAVTGSFYMLGAVLNELRA